jgi:hypothetical protein
MRGSPSEYPVPNEEGDLSAWVSEQGFEERLALFELQQFKGSIGDHLDDAIFSR